MEVRIRLQKIGKSSKHRYNFRIVAIGRNKGRDGSSLEILGHYDPSKKPAYLQVDQEKVAKWVKNGASMSETVSSLIKKAKKTG